MRAIGRFLVLFVLSVTLVACDGSSSGKSRDTTAPVITLTGANPQVIEAGTAYVELGARASDNRDGDLSNAIAIDAGAVDTQVPGSYVVTYTVTDAAGNTGTATRAVVVEDTTAPVITLLGDDPQVIVAGNAYIELGATATDTLDGDLSAKIVIDATAVDTMVTGDYAVTYDVTDAAGNAAATAIRIVRVQKPPPSNNALLATLSISPGEFDQIFQPQLRNYSSTVSLLCSTTRVLAIPEDENASISINSRRVDPGQLSEKISLEVGLTHILIRVTAEDGQTQETYEIDITRLAAVDFRQEAYVKASNTDASDQFGRALSLWNNTLVVGAPTEKSAATGIDGDQNDNTVSAGAVYIFERDNSATWIQKAYVKASNTESAAPHIGSYSDAFGTSVSIYGGMLAVGAGGEDSCAAGINGDQNDNSCPDAGAVYIFEKDSFGTWSQTSYIKASNTEAGDLFGFALALYEDVLAVSARDEDSAATGVGGDQYDDRACDAGAVYVFSKADGGWSQEAYIKASNTLPCDEVHQEVGTGFGSSLSMSGNTLAVGAPFENGASTGVNGDQFDFRKEDAGAVYLFERDASLEWRQVAYVKASNSDRRDNFGVSVSLSDDTLAVGADEEDSAATGVNGDQADNSGTGAGATYVFTRTPSGEWTQQAYLKSSNTESTTGGDNFGVSAAIAGDTLVIGAHAEDGGSTGINGDETDNSVFRSGAAYAFTRDADGLWSQQAYIKASNPDQTDWFGLNVALSYELIAVGAPSEESSAIGIDGDQSDNSFSSAGAVYVFH